LKCPSSTKVFQKNLKRATPRQTLGGEILPL
jgi:hypothetical protein